ncbi:hypothetical protein V8C86DRAFT_1212619 [Haematococcus lacustris]
MLSNGNGTHIGMLGDEEQTLHATLLGLERAVRESASGFANVSASKSQLQLLERQIQDRLAQMRGHIRELELLAEEQDTDDQARAVEVLLRQHKAEYESVRAAISSAKMAAKQAVDHAFAQQRKELLAGAALPTLLRKAATEQQVVQGAADITDSLRRTRQVLAQTLEQAAGNLAVVDSGNAVLADTAAELTGQQALFKEGNARFRQLKGQSSRNRWSLMLALLLFLSAATYVAHKRAPPIVKQPLDAALALAGRSLWSGSQLAGQGMRAAAGAAGQGVWAAGGLVTRSVGKQFSRLLDQAPGGQQQQEQRQQQEHWQQQQEDQGQEQEQGQDQGQGQEQQQHLVPGSRGSEGPQAGLPHAHGSGQEGQGQKLGPGPGRSSGPAMQLREGLERGPEPQSASDRDNISSGTGAERHPLPSGPPGASMPAALQGAALVPDHAMQQDAVQDPHPANAPNPGPFLSPHLTPGFAQGPDSAADYTATPGLDPSPGPGLPVPLDPSPALDPPPAPEPLSSQLHGPPSLEPDPATDHAPSPNPVSSTDPTPSPDSVSGLNLTPSLSPIGSATDSEEQLRDAGLSATPARLAPSLQSTQGLSLDPLAMPAAPSTLPADVQQDSAHTAGVDSPSNHHGSGRRPSARGNIPSSSGEGSDSATVGVGPPLLADGLSELSTLLASWRGGRDQQQGAARGVQPAELGRVVPAALGVTREGEGGAEGRGQELQAAGGELNAAPADPDAEQPLGRAMVDHAAEPHRMLATGRMGTGALGGSIGIWPAANSSVKGGQQQGAGQGPGQGPEGGAEQVKEGLLEGVDSPTQVHLALDHLRDELQPWQHRLVLPAKEAAVETAVRLGEDAGQGLVVMPAALVAAPDPAPDAAAPDAAAPQAAAPDAPAPEAAAPDAAAPDAAAPHAAAPDAAAPDAAAPDAAAPDAAAPHAAAPDAAAPQAAAPDAPAPEAAAPDAAAPDAAAPDAAAPDAAAPDAAAPDAAAPDAAAPDAAAPDAAAPDAAAPHAAAPDAAAPQAAAPDAAAPEAAAPDAAAPDAAAPDAAAPDAAAPYAAAPDAAAPDAAAPDAAAPHAAAPDAAAPDAAAPDAAAPHAAAPDAAAPDAAAPDAAAPDAAAPDAAAPDAAAPDAAAPDAAAPDAAAPQAAAPDAAAPDAPAPEAAAPDAAAPDAAAPDAAAPDAAAPDAAAPDAAAPDAAAPDAAAPDAAAPDTAAPQAAAPDAAAPDAPAPEAAAPDAAAPDAAAPDAAAPDAAAPDAAAPDAAAPHAAAPDAAAPDAAAPDAAAPEAAAPQAAPDAAAPEAAPDAAAPEAAAPDAAPPEAAAPDAPAPEAAAPDAAAPDAAAPDAAAPEAAPDAAAPEAAPDAAPPEAAPDAATPDEAPDAAAPEAAPDAATPDAAPDAAAPKAGPDAAPTSGVPMAVLAGQMESMVASSPHLALLLATPAMEAPATTALHDSVHAASDAADSAEQCSSTPVARAGKSDAPEGSHDEGPELPVRHPAAVPEAAAAPPHDLVANVHSAARTAEGNTESGVGRGDSSFASNHNTAVSLGFPAPHQGQGDALSCPANLGTRERGQQGSADMCEVATDHDKGPQGHRLVAAAA